MACREEENCHFEQEKEVPGMLGMRKNLPGRAKAEMQIGKMFASELVVKEVKLPDADCAR